MSGWIKLHRVLAGSAIGNKPDYLAVWVHLLLSATHRPREMLVGRQIVKLETGQLVFGRKAFSAKTGVSEAVIRSALDAFKSLKQITIKTTTKYSIITVTKWSEYQSEEPANNLKKTSKQPTVNHKQEGKELQKGRSKALVTDESATDDQDDLFGNPESPPPKSRARAKPEIDYAEIVAAYNELCSGKGKLVGCEAITDARKKLMDKALDIKVGGEKPFREYGIDYWRAYFSICPNDPHWCGMSPGGWKAGFDFVLKEKNIIAALEKNNG